jgi:hypothetical protein
MRHVLSAAAMMGGALLTVSLLSIVLQTMALSH